MSENIKKSILVKLIKNAVWMRAYLKYMGIAKFDPAQPEVQELEKAVLGLVSELQFYGVVRHDLHIYDGVVIKHLGPEDDK